MTVKSLSHSSLEDNRFYRSMLVGNTPFSPSAYDLLETQVLSSSAASVTFTGLGSYSDYKHLQIRLVGQNTDANNFMRDLQIQFNGDTGSNYIYHKLTGRNGSVTSSTDGTQNLINLADTFPGAGTSGQFGAAVVDILDFSNTSKNTTVRALTGGIVASENSVGLSSGLWVNTNAVTSIAISTSTNMNTGSRFSLYGVK